MGTVSDTSNEREGGDAPDDATAEGRFTIGLEIPIAVPPIRVWKALLDPADMRAWFCQHAEVQPRTDGVFGFGGRYTYRLGGPENEGQRLIGLETGRSVTYSWDVERRPTRVRYVLASIRGDCRLRVYHHLEGRPHRDWRGDIADQYPWEVYLLNLKTHLERGDAGIRVDYESIPDGRHTIGGAVRCASERIWRVLTDRDECSQRAGEALEFDAKGGEGWNELFGKVENVEILSGRRLTQRWTTPERDGTVMIQWELVSKGVQSMLTLTTWGEGRAESWHEGQAGVWTHLLWARLFNHLKYYSETGSLTALKRLTGEY
jgi:uncharacterized protein YndB with AHSA1/START domain